MDLSSASDDDLRLQLNDAMQRRMDSPDRADHDRAGQDVLDLALEHRRRGLRLTD